MYLDNLPVLAADYRKNRDAKAKLGSVPINAVEP
jgi:hypothetical protein